MTLARALGSWSVAGLLALACGNACSADDPKDAAASGDAGLDAAADAPVLPEGGGPCDAVYAAPAHEGANHVDDCSPVSYASNPPASGNHYSTWAAFGVYGEPLPRGFWVHSLEHGAVVFSYRPGAADVDQAEALLTTLVDPDCADPARIILTPDPLLDSEWAASAWGVTLRASCFDPQAFRNFFEQFVGHAPENICSPHPSFLTPEALADKPAGCGS